MGVEEKDDKRTHKCPGCKIPHSIHSFGVPGPHCQGTTGLPSTESSNAPALSEIPGTPTGDKAAAQNVDISALEVQDEESVVADEEAVLQQKLKQLHMAEDTLQKKKRVELLKKAIVEAEQRLANLTGSPPSSSSATNATNLQNPPFLQSVAAGIANTTGQAPPQLPLDVLLAGAPPSAVNMAATNDLGSGATNQAFPNSTGASDGLGISPDGPLQLPQAQQESLMFLKPAHLAKGERVLRIVDYIDNIVPNTDERTISEVGYTKLLVSYGPKKPKLESISLAQWVIANTRIFFTLLQLGKLPSPQDVQHYLAYTVKVMELSTKFTWVSVLRFDDEFRHLQAIYRYPWSYDSNHLHTVVLEPISASPSLKNATKGSQGTSPGSSFASFTPDGKVICRNFNRIKGCTLFECHFAHVCNRKVNGKACAQSHPFHSHPKGTPPNPTPPAGPQ